MITNKKEAASDVSGIGDGKERIAKVTIPDIDTTMNQDKIQEAFEIASMYSTATKLQEEATECAET